MKLLGVTSFLLLLFILITGCGQEKTEEKVMAIEYGEPAGVVEDLISKISNASPEDHQGIYQVWAEDNKYQLFPVVESNTVTFVYYHVGPEQLEQVSLSWELNNYDRTAIPMKQVSNSSLYYISVITESPIGIQYGFTLLEPEESRGDFIRDPLNGNVEYGLAIRSVIEDENSENGYLQHIKDVKPESEYYELKERDIHVYLPPAYYTDTDKKYPVLYMQDGQNIWESEQANFGGWKMDTTASEMILSGSIEPLIIVGIENPGEYYLRAGEYVGFSYSYEEMGEGYTNLGQDYTNMSLAYEEFVINQVKPMIEEKYRIKTGAENSGIGGSSFGAGVSLFLGFRNPDVFSKIAALSGGDYSGTEKSIKIKPFWVFDYLIKETIHAGSDLKIYLDCGDQDVDKIFVKKTKDMYSALTNLDFKESSNLYYLIAEGEGHNEKAWAERVPLFLEFLFGTEDAETEEK